MNSTEAYPADDPVAWSHAENPYGNRLFDETLSNKDTFDAKFHGTFVVKPNSRSSLKGAGAVIACFLGGQIAFGAPAAKTRSNGEVLFCENLAMADAAARSQRDHEYHNGRSEEPIPATVLNGEAVGVEPKSSEIGPTETDRFDEDADRN